MIDYINVLNSILTRIEEQLLTDDEIETIKPKDVTDLQEQYDTLYSIINDRGVDITNAIKKLRMDALVRNIEIGVKKTSKTNIYIGGGLD
jgi:phosphotransacetylase